MTTRESLTDTELEAMLARLTTRGWTDNLETAIMAEVDATPQRHRLRFPRPAWRLPLQPELRVLWYLALIGLLLALAAGTAIVGSRLFDRTHRIPDAPAVLVPSGLETLSDAVTYWSTVVDDQGVLWAVGQGTLVRYDPTTGDGRRWTVDDDFRFAGASTGSTWITPARAGGVWLVGTQTLLRFDGTDFRDMVDLGADVMSATQAPDGTLWVATVDGHLVHVVGSSRTRVAVPSQTSEAYVSAIAVDAAGHVWCGLTEAGEVTSGWVARYDGASWQTFDEKDAPPLDRGVEVISPLLDGSVWVGTQWSTSFDTGTSSGGLAYYDGVRWTDVGAGEAALQHLTVTSVTAGADGSIWAAFILPDGSIGVAQRTAGTWTTYGTADGLPGSDETNYARVEVIPTGDHVFAGTGTGIYELADGRWERVWPETPPTGPDDRGPSQLVARSHDEAWVATWNGVWHYAAGAWTELRTPSSMGTIRDLLVTPDGTVWLAADGGLWHQAGSEWTHVGVEPARGIGIDGDGRVWATVQSMADARLWSLQAYALVDGTWTDQERLQPRLPLSQPMATADHLAFGDDGTIWAGSEGVWGYAGGLVRSAHGTWERINPRGGDGDLIVTDLAVTSTGDVWVVGADVTYSESTVGGVTSGTTTEGAHWIARFDGTSWEVFAEADRGPAVEVVGSPLAVAPDGSIWVASADGLARFDGTSWRDVRSEAAYDGVAVAPDGTVWVVGRSGVGRLTDGGEQ